MKRDSRMEIKKLCVGGKIRRYTAKKPPTDSAAQPYRNNRQIGVFILEERIKM